MQAQSIRGKCPYHHHLKNKHQIPKALLETPIILISEFNSEKLKALFVKQVLLTIRGLEDFGRSTTLSYIAFAIARVFSLLEKNLLGSNNTSQLTIRVFTFSINYFLK